MTGESMTGEDALFHYAPLDGTPGDGEPAQRLPFDLQA